MKLGIIPEPLEMRVGTENVFTLTRLCEVEYDEGSKKAYYAFVKFLSDAFSMSLLGTGKERVILRINDSLECAEGYTLTVYEDTAIIEGKDEAGVFYGVQSFKQLLFQSDLILPEIYIKDSPRFSNRGFMLDCGRYFFTKEAVKVFLEMMALHKLNTFNWHLSDDQGFRAQVLEKLLLTEIGSYRSHTGFNSLKHEGYYTVDDMKEIVDYAHNLCIKVVPEIESPGHTVAMIAAYPELSCLEKQIEVASDFGVKKDVLCVGKESTFEFMESMFDELLETFTDGIFHLGSSDVSTERWKMCPLCQKRIETEGLKNESDLYRYYISRIGKYLKNKGVEAVLRDGDKNVNIDSYIKTESAVKEFIVSAKDAYSLDLPYAIVSLKDTYEYEPSKNECGEKIIGVEACLWTEYVPTMEKAGYCTYPRLGAFSETAWSQEANKNYDAFKEKLPGYYRLLQGHGVDTADTRQAEPGLIKKTGNRILWKALKLLQSK